MYVAGMKPAQSATVLVALIAVAGLLWFNWPGADQPAQVQQSVAAGWQQAGAANPFAQGSASAERLAPAGNAVPNSPQPPDLASTSLAGTQPDGEWGVNAQGQLKASRALRQRFDYYLSLIGEMPLASIEAALRAAAEKDLKEPALGQVLALFQRYVQLQQYSWKHAVNPQRPESWSAALTERQIMRCQMLGADAAYAFYAEEEAQLQQMLAQVQGAQISQSNQTTLAIAPSPHPQALEREAAVKAEWQQWEQRLDAARHQIKAYTQAPELSAPQRQQAIEQYLTNQFQGTELVRARALLGV
jgi:lipase chaperone LimK